jgi:hypothetical protein
LDVGLVLFGGALVELVRWLRGLRYPVQMTVETVSEAEANTVQEVAARSRRAQEQMRRVAYRSNQRGEQR